MASCGGAAASPVEMELAWHLLTVLVRLGRPAAVSDLAAAAAAASPSISPEVIERMCRIDGSPLQISGGGVVTVSETAVLAFLRFVGWDFRVPRVWLRPPEVWRRWGEVVIRYERKRKVSDVSCFGDKRRRLLAPSTDLMEHSEHLSNQLVAQTCAPAATGEVHLEVTQELRDRLPTFRTFISEPCLGFSTGVTLVHNVAKNTTLSLQPKPDKSLMGDEDTVFRNMAFALVPTNLSDCCSVNLPPLASVDNSKSANTEVDGRSQRIGESEQASFLNCRVEDSEDLEKESIHPTTILAVVAGENKNEVDEDLNLVIPGSPIKYNTKREDSIEAFDNTPNQANGIRYNCPNAEHQDNVPTCGQENNLLGAKACAEVCKDKTTQILLHRPMDRLDTKAGSIAAQMSRNSNPEALPQEPTRYDCTDMRNLNIIAESRESEYQNIGEHPCNEAKANVSKNGQDRVVMKQNGKSKKNELPKEDKDCVAVKAQKGHVVPKPLPSFKGFVIEEEEGSGGYGTVYRALRKKDGQIFAIKCPHPNAHPHHVNNELKMLERFGGKSCVIKYECSLKSGDLECFVLEHVKHDRPEILKRDISLLELRWYGHCLFRALASLHRQGVVHRDVKPGNFLFSRNLKKGYLIDFNLANDLHQKFLKNGKSETISCGKETESRTSTKLAVVHAKEQAADSKQPLPLKRKRSSRSLVDSTPKIDSKSKHGSQAADVSGVTSAKDPTSTKTSLDRLKQPMPYKGRKELMNFLHETMHSPNKNTTPAPVSQRKRVAAPVTSVDRKLFNMTPMPLRSGGSVVAGSGMFNNKGHGKHRREGPCVGTKGFRAPEVLFRSFHQSCKVDVWSAGVTLLYLIIGRTPFGGDPEQNIKEIAKLKGSEELWEVAKLHNCESSYPSDLFDVKSLRSVDLREWCAANTRRPEFLEMIPDSLFDLLDKCLAVNPRCRLASEDALMHEFFAPCRDSFIRKLKMPRRSTGSDAASSSHQNTALTAKHSARVPASTVQTSVLTPVVTDKKIDLNLPP
ncbi:hypothetical protein HU200_041915 [Digitaria exilis]|uniref:non-specific serine/threonine protein kinase n=1 Tax=Digitaria exilis TaxID=1010633 RepID=A0A835BBP6_9POAL|nr:hypothetical protein HU200_041915 [Digitaria exilis]